ncbi:hypothetical protein PACID_15410 [Acidipropionibacterium acidipropionici ATCC 4875]|uniref:Uncharacterized protein n=1 Tax=Acidipropionibacterium acidipropionici (strain ATCC 4875 / DSM 20272 / JCM 6432 / NBRC 12425 / NCIMB 8070 / 4) TaxID=1171373 RepID=K7RN45_ACIA4|nr:hypothetical protein [Acidipropionibacterium acidipropionici]AFV89354.1 hypothetical protein PACID_15410 [Acidipropionibacterium acidipropionici ATCC 4875]
MSKKLVSVSPTGAFEVDLDDGRTLSGKSKLIDVVKWERQHKKGFLAGGDLSFQKMLWVAYSALKRGDDQIPDINTADSFIDKVEDLRQEGPDDADEGEGDGDEGVELPNLGQADTAV